MHVPPQLICVPGHETLHAPLLHTFPLVQAVPAVPEAALHVPLAPQLVELVLGSMQMPPQLICVPGHETWHVPLLHTLPLVQAVPAVPDAALHVPLAPQLVGLVLGSMQMPPQLICVPGHDTWHVPLLHTLPFVHA